VLQKHFVICDLQKSVQKAKVLYSKVDKTCFVQENMLTFKSLLVIPPSVFFLITIVIQMKKTHVLFDKVTSIMI